MSFKPFDYERYGEPGSRILGSNYYRAYTEEGEPYRTSDPDEPGCLKHGTPAIRRTTPNIETPSPWLENNVRELEG